jgi:hypothetical protein
MGDDGAADPNGALFVDSLVGLQQFIFANAAVELPEPLRPEEIVDPTFAREAVEILGPFQP